MENQYPKNDLTIVEMREEVKVSFEEGKSGKKTFDKRKIQCYNYDKFGHYSYEC